MASLYPADCNQLDDTVELSKSNVIFLGAFENSQLTGMGAVKILAEDTRYGEVKRLFIPEAYRGKGISKGIMKSLETILIEQGINIMRLEAGVNQPEALGLYQSLGYIKRDAFGSYTENPYSVFLEKQLKP